MAVDRVIHVGPPVGGLTDFPEHARPEQATQALNCEFRYGGVSTRAGSTQIHRNFYEQGGVARRGTVKLVAPHRGATYGQMIAVGFVPLEGAQTNSQRLILAFAESGEYAEPGDAPLAPSFHAELTAPANNLVASGSVNFLDRPRLGDTFTLGSIVFTAAAAENIPAREFAAQGAFTKEQSATSLAACINDANNQAAIAAANLGASATAEANGAVVILTATVQGAAGELGMAVDCPIFYIGSVIVDVPLYGDQLLVGGVDFTCGAAEDIPGRIFLGGIANTSEDAASSLAACINDPANQALIAAGNPAGVSATATIPIANPSTIILTATVSGPDGELLLLGAPESTTGYNRVTIAEDDDPLDIHQFLLGDFWTFYPTGFPPPPAIDTINFLSDWVNNNAAQWQAAYAGTYPIAVAHPWGFELMASDATPRGWWECEIAPPRRGQVASLFFTHGETYLHPSGDTLAPDGEVRMDASSATLVCPAIHLSVGAEDRWDSCSFWPLTDVDPALVVCARNSDPSQPNVFITARGADHAMTAVGIVGRNRTDHHFHGEELVGSAYSDDPGTYVVAPISAKFCRPHAGRLILGGIYPMRGLPQAGMSQLWYSNLGDPYGWPTENIVPAYGRDMSPISGLGCWQGNIAVFREGSIGLFRLDGYSNPTFRELVTGRGCAAHGTILDDINGKTLFLSWDGFYAFNGSADPEYLSKPIERRLRRLTGNFGAAWAVHYPVARQVWLGIPTDGGGAPDAVFVMDYSYSPPAWSEYRYYAETGADAPPYRIGGIASSEDGRSLYGIKQRSVTGTLDYGAFDRGPGDDCGRPGLGMEGLPFVSRYESGPIEYDRNTVNRWRYVRPVLRPTGSAVARFFWRRDSQPFTEGRLGQYVDQSVAPPGGPSLGSFVLGLDSLTGVDDWQPRLDVHTGGTGRYGRVGVETLGLYPYDTFDLRGFEIDELNRQVRR